MPLLQNMRFLIPLTILLTSALCSCRSQKHITEQSTEQTTVAVEHHSEATAADDLIAAIKTNSDITLSEVTITFFPPDSTHPDARAAPASMTIGNLKACKNTDTQLRHKAEATENETVNLNAASDTAQASTTDNEVNTLSPPTSVLTLLIIGLIVIAAIAYIVYRIRSPTK